MKLTFLTRTRDETDPEIIATLERKGWTAHADPVYDPATETAGFHDGAWHVEPLPPPRVDGVTPRQLRLWLLSRGLLDAVEASIAGMEGEEGRKAKIDWEYSGIFLRAHPLVTVLGTALGLTEEETDTAFLEASVL